MSIDVVVRFTGLVLMHERLNENPPIVDLVLPQAPCKDSSGSSYPHYSRLVVPAREIDWSATAGPDLIVSAPDGDALCIWNLAAFESIDLPSPKSPLPLTASTVKPANPAFPQSIEERRSLHWIYRLSGGPYVRNSTKVTQASLSTGHLEAAGFEADPSDTVSGGLLRYGFASQSSAADPNYDRVLALNLVWSSPSIPAAYKAEFKLVAKAAKLINLRMDVARVVHVSICNEPSMPCAGGKGGLFEDHLALYDLVKDANGKTPPMDRRRVPCLPKAGGGSVPPPSVGSGFCPPGGIP